MKRIGYVCLFILVIASFITAYAEGHVEISSKGTANVRAKADTDSQVVGRVNPGEVFIFTDVAKNGWYRIILSDGTEGYISGKMVRVVDGDVQGVSSTPVVSPNPMSLFKVDSKAVGVEFGSNLKSVAQDFQLIDVSHSFGMINLDTASTAKKITFAGVRIHGMQPKYRGSGDTNVLNEMNIILPYTSKSTENLVTMKNAISKIFGKPEIIEKGKSTSGFYLNGRAVMESSIWKMEYKWETKSDIITIDYSAKKDKKTIIKDSQIGIVIIHKDEEDNITHDEKSVETNYNEDSVIFSENSPSSDNDNHSLSLFTVNSRPLQIDLWETCENVVKAFRLEEPNYDIATTRTYTFASNSNTSNVEFGNYKISNVILKFNSPRKDGNLFQVEIPLSVSETKEAFEIIYDAICKKYGTPVKNVVGMKDLIESGPARYEQYDTSFKWMINKDMVCVIYIREFSRKR